MRAQFLWCVGRIGHVFIRLKFKQPAKNGLPDITDIIGQLFYRIQIARCASHNSKSVADQPFHQRPDTIIPGQRIKRHTDRFMIQRRAVPWLCRRQAHAIARHCKFCKECGTIFRLHVEIGPLQNKRRCIARQLG